jgi:TldD protein
VADIKEIKTFLGKLVSQIETTAPYADALFMHNELRSLAKDTTGIEPQNGAEMGVRIRAFDGLQYHEVSVTGWQPAVLQAEVQQLIARLKARPITGKTVNLKLDRDILDKEFSTHAQIDPAGVQISQKANAITQLHEKVIKTSSEFVNCRVAYREYEEKRVFVNRYKKLSSRWTGCAIVIVPFVQTADGQTRYDYFSNFSNGFEATHIPEQKLQDFLKRALKVKAAGRIPPGKYTAVLSPNLSGLLAHESFGHGMESDMIMKGRAKAEEFLGKKIASAKVNICDDPAMPNAHGTFFFDDEGMLPQRTLLVKGGIVTAPITESYSAARRGFARTANGRAESYDHKTYARMSNTFFLPGKDDPKTMVKEVKNGMYLHHGGSGMEDPKGWGVQIAGVLCERIKNGKLTGEFFYEATVSGFLPKVLGNITAVGKDFEIQQDAGFCSKGHKEVVRVSSGGPHLLIKELDLT